MTIYAYTQSAVKLQANQDKVSATTGDLIDTDNLDSNVQSLGYSKYTENRFKGNQNWNIKGGTNNPIPSATPTLYTVGDEVAFGRFCVGADLVNATYIGGLFDADSGSYYIEYEGVDLTSDFFGIKLSDDTISQTGCSLSFTGGNTRMTVDMSVAPAHKFAGLSSESGIWPDINNNDSINHSYVDLLKRRTIQDLTGSRSANVLYTNDTDIDIEITVSYSANAGTARFTLEIDGIGIPVGTSSNSASVQASITKTIPPQSTYEITPSVAPISGSLVLFTELKV